MVYTQEVKGVFGKSSTNGRLPDGFRHHLEFLVSHTTSKITKVVSLPTEVWVSNLFSESYNILLLHKTITDISAQ